MINIRARKRRQILGSIFPPSSFPFHRSGNISQEGKEEEEEAKRLKKKEWYASIFRLLTQTECLRGVSLFFWESASSVSA